MKKRQDIKKRQDMKIPGMKIVVKDDRFMGDFQAIHGKMEKRNLYPRLKKIPKNEIWIRRSNFENRDKRDPTSRDAILEHERYELLLIAGGMTYRKAHGAVVHALRPQRKRQSIYFKRKEKQAKRKKDVSLGIYRVTGKKTIKSRNIKLNGFDVELYHVSFYGDRVSHRARCDIGIGVRAANLRSNRSLEATKVDGTIAQTSQKMRELSRTAYKTVLELVKRYPMHLGKNVHYGGLDVASAFTYDVYSHGKFLHSDDKMLSHELPWKDRSKNPFKDIDKVAVDELRLLSSRDYKEFIVREFRFWISAYAW